nr:MULTISPECIES: hypothetical protein [unclassified Martelella]
MGFERVERGLDAEPFDFDGFCRMVVKSAILIKDHHRQNAFMAAAVGVDVAHDRAEPACEIFTPPLQAPLERDHERILQQVIAVRGRSGKRSGGAAKARQLTHELGLEFGTRRRSLAWTLRRLTAIMPGAPPASCRYRRSGR